MTPPLLVSFVPPYAILLFCDELRVRFCKSGFYVSPRTGVLACFSSNTSNPRVMYAMRRRVEQKAISALKEGDDERALEQALELCIHAD